MKTGRNYKRPTLYNLGKFARNNRLWMRLKTIGKLLMSCDRGTHGESVLHNACRCGNSSLVKTIVNMAGSAELSRKDVAGEILIFFFKG